MVTLGSILAWCTLAALTPRDRFASVGKHWRINWLRGGNLVVLAVVVLVAIVAIAVFMQLYRHRRQVWALFRQQADDMGLEPEQRDLLEQMAATARWADPLGLLTTPEVFDRAVARLGASHDDKPVASLRSQLGLTAKLTVDLAAGQAPDAGTRLMALLADGTEVPIQLVSASSKQTVVACEQPIETAPGETWRIRYAVQGAMAQASFRVVHQNGPRVLLMPISRTRVLERRRFLRVEDDRAARLAVLPMTRPEPIEDGLMFHEGALADSGGPGMRVRVQCPSRHFTIGHKALVMVQLNKHLCLQAVGRIRRSEGAGEGETTVSLEMTDLDQEEQAVLLREIAKTRPRGAANPQADVRQEVPV